MISAKLTALLRGTVAAGGRITVLTGAGISAESGIPTFRGAEGYWTVGSREYRPQEMATFGMFRRQPWEVWRWYLYRRGVCRRAEPNAGHRALVTLEQALGERFLLITQNVDGLHLRAGNSPARTFQIHGNIDFMRCVSECTDETFPIPDGVWLAEKSSPLPAGIENMLVCPRCGEVTRPHVLWFDEYYDEIHYRYQSSLYAASRTDLLLVVGTSGATNLPLQVAQSVGGRGGVIVDVNVRQNPFGDYAVDHGGFFVQARGGDVLPEIIAALVSGNQ